MNIKDHYLTSCAKNHLLPVLSLYSSQCDSAVELGTGQIVSTWGLLYGLSLNKSSGKDLRCVDISPPIDQGALSEYLDLISLSKDNNVHFSYRQLDSLSLVPRKCDLLFIDTDHKAETLIQELWLYANMVNKYILIHGTVIDKEMDRAIFDFLLCNKNWKFRESYQYGLGITVLERIKEIFKPKAFFVISRFNEDVSWIKDLSDEYIIYNKGASLDGYREKQVANFGGNQHDICSYIYENYDNLPDLIAFVQGNPFDHCLVPRFYDLIYRECFTPIFGDKNYPDGNYSEENTSWYIHDNICKLDNGCKFSSFDQYMRSLFSDYTGMPILIFPPGSQMIVEKRQCLFYSRDFWKKLTSFFPTNTPLCVEGHVVERSMQIIFQNIFKERK